MIPRKNNIPKKYFPTVLKGFSINSAYFRVVISNTIKDQNPHIAVVISKKYVKLSTERNFFKRIISQKILEKLSLIPPKTMVFLIQKKVDYEKNKKGRSLAAHQIGLDCEQVITSIIKKYE